MTMGSIKCPHCGAANEGQGSFCESCGMALPTVSSGPRVVNVATGIAQTSVGMGLQTGELDKQAKSASGALLAVAIIQMIVGAVVLLVVKNLPSVNAAARDRMQLIGIATFVISSLYWGLYFWAKYQPLPAAIVGLTVYVTLIAINVTVTLQQSMHAAPGSVHGIGIGWLDILIMVVLGRAISAGVKYRNLKKQIGG
jgi:hypothetical protein